MIIKMPKPTKAEMIRTFFNQWDPLDYVDKAGFMYYNYEAEELAQRIRKNSKPETIAAHIKKRMPDSKVIIFGKHEFKMSDFVFADRYYHIDEIPEDVSIDYAFECAGGSGVAPAINQIIDYIKPEGCIASMGVSEENVPINTRMVLEKGLTIFGSSRSGIKDFENVLTLYREKPEIT